MKLFEFLLSALVAISTVDTMMSVENDLIKVDTFTTNATSVNINKLMDFIMIHAGDWIEQSDFFPIILESYTEKLEDPDAWFKLTAELISTNGLLSHLTTVVRSGNAIMSYDKSNSWLRIKTSASIRQISFRYDYPATISIFGFSGWVEGSTDCLVFAVDFAVDLNDFMIFMTDFRVVSFGDINISLQGNFLTDWIGNFWINKEGSGFNEPINTALSDQIKNITKQFVNELNLNVSSDDFNMNLNTSQC